MSTVDERIVRMKWEDSDFAKAAQNTLKLLENVDSSIQKLSGVITNPYSIALKTMEGVADSMKKVSSIAQEATSGLGNGAQSALKSFTGLDDGIKKIGANLAGIFTKVDSSPVEEAAAKISNAFTLTGRIANKALDEIASKAIHIGETVANALVIRPISSGFEEYGLLMDSTQVILANTGRSLEDVKSTLDDLNHYADKTIYNFAEMTNAIGRFSAAGVGLEDSVQAIEGLSNLSALVGASAQQNISAMDATSKALAGGSMKLRQWMQFELAGSLGGKVFRDELVKTAQELGVFTHAWDDATGKSIDGAELMTKAQTEFRETLKYGWVTSDVLLQTLAKFNDETTELGQKAIKAATEVRTFKKMWDAMQEAVQSSWSESFQYIFGDYMEGTNLWTSINDEIGGLLANINDARNEMLKFWHDMGGREAFIEGVATAYHKLGDALAPVKEALKSIFPWLTYDSDTRGGILVQASIAFRDWAKGLQISEDRAAKLYNVLTLLKIPVDEFRKFIDSDGFKGLSTAIGGIVDSALSLGNAFANAVRAMDLGSVGLGSVYAKFADALNGISKTLKIITDSGGVALGLAKDGSFIFHDFETMFRNLLSPLRFILDALTRINVSDLASIGRDSFRILASAFDAASSAVSEFIGALDASLVGNAVHQVAEYLREIREFTNSVEGNKKLTEVFSGVANAVKGVVKLIVSLVSIVTKVIADFTRSGGLMSVVKTIVNLKNILINIGNIFVDVVQKKFGSNLSMLGERVARIKEAFEALSRFMLRLSERSLFGKAIEESGKLEGIKKTVFSWTSIIDKLLAPVQYLFEVFQKVDFNNITRIGVHAFKILIAVLNAASISVDKFFGTLDSSWLAVVIEDIRQATKGVREFFESAEGQEMLITAFNMIATSINRVIDVIKFLYTTAKTVITEFTESGGFQSILNIFTNLSQAAANFADVVKNAISSEFGESLGNAGSILAGILGILETISAIILRLSTRSLFEDIDETTGAFENSKKVAYSLLGIIQNMLSPVKYLLDLVKSVDPNNLYRIFSHVLKGSIAVINAASISLRDFFESLNTKWFERLVEDIRQVTKEIRLFLQSAQGQEILINFFSIFTGVAHIAYDAAVQVLGVIHKIMNSELFKTGVDAITRIGAAIIGFASDAINGFERFLRKHKVITKAFEELGKIAEPFFEGLVTFLSAFADSLEALTGQKIDWDKFFPEAASKAIEKINQGLDWLKEKAGNIGAYLIEQFSGMTPELAEGETYFDYMLKKLSAGWEKLKGWLSSIGGAIFDALKNAIFGREVSGETLVDTPEILENPIINTLKTLGEFVGTVIGIAGGAFRIVVDVLVQAFGVITKIANSDLFKNGVATIGRLATAAITCITNVVSGIETYLREHKVIQTALEWIGDKVGPIFEMIVSGLSKVAEFIENIAAGSVDWNSLFPETVSNAITGITDGISWLKDKATGVGKYIGDQFSEMKTELDGGESYFDVFAKRLGSGIDTLKENLKSAGGTVFEALKGAIFGHEVGASTLTDEMPKEADEVEKAGLPIIENIKGLGDKIRDAFKEGTLGETISDGFSDFVSNAQGKWNDVENVAKNYFERFITAFNKYYKEFKEFAGKVPGMILNAIFGGDLNIDGTIDNGILGNLIQGIDKFINVDLAGRIAGLMDRNAEALAPVKTAFEKVSAIIKPIFGELGEVYQASIGSLSEFFAGKDGLITFSDVVDRVLEFSRLFRSFKITELISSFSGLNKRFEKGAKQFQKESKGLGTSIKSIFDGIGGKDNGLFATISKAITKFQETADTFSNTTSKDLLDKLIKPFDNFFNKTIKGSIKRLSKGGTKALKDAGAGLKKFLKDGVGKFMKDAGKGVKRYLTGKAIKEAGEGLFKFAIAVGILALALYGLSKIPTEQLEKGGIALAGIVGALLAVVVAIALLQKKNEGKFSAAIGGLKALDGNVIEIGDALGKTLDGFKKALSKLAAIGLIIAFAIAIKTVISGIAKIGEMKPEKAIVGILGMALVIWALSNAVKKILQASKSGVGETGASLRQVLAMLAFIALIKTGIEGVLKIGDMTWGDMLKGVIAMGVLMVALAISLELMFDAMKTRNGDTGASLRQVFAILAMCVAVNTLANAVIKISQLSLPEIVLAGVVVSALMGVFALVIKFINDSSISGQQSNTFEILALAAAVWVMGDAVKKIAKLGTADAVLATACIGALMGVFAFVMKAASSINTGAVAAIAVIGVAAAALMLLLNYLSEHMGNEQADRFKKLAESLAMTMLAFSGALVACALVGKFVKGGEVLSGLLSLAEVIVVVIAVLTAIGAVFNVLDTLFNGAATKALDKLVVVFEKIGSAIGGFFGSVVGSFESSRAKHLEEVGKSLTTFAENAKPFLELVGDEKKLRGITKGVSSLAGAILKMTGADLLRRLNKLTGGGSNPFDQFSTMLKQLGPVLSDFDKSIDGINVKKVSKAMDAFSQLVKAAQKIPNQGGKIADFFGDNTLDQFATGLAKFTPRFGEFLDAMKAADLFGANRKNVDRAIDFAVKVAEFADKIPNQGGIIADIFGDNTLGKFANGLAKFTPEFGGFLTAMKEQDLLGDNADKVQKALDFASQIVGFVNDLPEVTVTEAPDGTVFSDDRLTSFAAGLTKFTPSLISFMDETSKYDYGEDGEEKVKTAIRFARAIVRFVNSLQPSKTVQLGDTTIYTDNALIQLATGLGDFSETFSTFLEKMTTVSYDKSKVQTAIDLATATAAFVNGLEAGGFTFKIADKLSEITGGKLGGTFVFSTSPLITLAAGLSEFAPSFSTFLETLSGSNFDSTKVADAIEYAKGAAIMAALAPQFNGLNELVWGKTDLDEFGQQLAKFAPNFKTYLETVGGAKYDDDVVSKSNTLMQSLADIAGTIKGKEGVLKEFFFGDESLTGIAEGLGAYADSMAVYSQALEGIDWENAEKANDFIKDLADLADKAISVNNLTMLPLDAIVEEIDRQMKGLGGEISSAVYDMSNDPDTEADVRASAEHFGEVITGGIIDGYDNTIGETKEHVDGSVTDWLNTLKGTVEGLVTTNSGESAKALAGVINDDVDNMRNELEPNMYAAMAIVVGKGVLAVEEKYNDFFNAGSYAIGGLINGIASREQEVYDRLSNLAQATANVMAAGLDEHSPSRIFEKLGIFMPMGLENGIVKGAPSALETLKTALIQPINTMSSMLNDDIEYTPRIRPVVDLAGAESSVHTLNDMFGAKSIGLTDATMKLSSYNAKARRSAATKIYNDKNVVNAIDGLKGDIAALGGSIKNMGLYMDGDTLVGSIVDKVDRKLGTNQVRRKRYA